MIYMRVRNVFFRLQLSTWTIPLTLTLSENLKTLFCTLLRSSSTIAWREKAQESFWKISGRVKVSGIDNSLSERWQTPNVGRLKPIYIRNNSDNNIGLYFDSAILPTWIFSKWRLFSNTSALLRVVLKNKRFQLDFLYVGKFIICYKLIIMILRGTPELQFPLPNCKHKTGKCVCIRSWTYCTWY